MSWRIPRTIQYCSASIDGVTTSISTVEKPGPNTMAVPSCTHQSARAGFGALLV